MNDAAKNEKDVREYILVYKKRAFIFLVNLLCELFGLEKDDTSSIMDFLNQKYKEKYRADLGCKRSTYFSWYYDGNVPVTKFINQINQFHFPFHSFLEWINILHPDRPVDPQTSYGIIPKEMWKEVTLKLDDFRRDVERFCTDEEKQKLPYYQNGHTEVSIREMLEIISLHPKEMPVFHYILDPNIPFPGIMSLSEAEKMKLAIKVLQDRTNSMQREFDRKSQRVSEHELIVDERLDRLEIRNRSEMIESSMNRKRQNESDRKEANRVREHLKYEKRKKR